jgi:hypothetical protein
MALSSLPAQALPELGLRVVKIDQSGIQALPDLQASTATLISQSQPEPAAPDQDVIRLASGTEEFAFRCDPTLAPLADEQVVVRDLDGNIIEIISSSRATISGTTLTIPHQEAVQVGQTVRVDLPGSWATSCAEATRLFTVRRGAVVAGGGGAPGWIWLPIIAAGALVGCAIGGCFDGGDGGGGGNSSR